MLYFPQIIFGESEWSFHACSWYKILEKMMHILVVTLSLLFDEIPEHS